MGELDGIAATRLITTAAPDTKVILVSTYELEDLPPGALASGAVGYVNKDELSPKVVRRLWEGRCRPDARHTRLSDRHTLAASQVGSGRVPVTVVPCPGCDRTVTVPPKAPRRSVMLTNPWPSPEADCGVEAGTVVADLEAENPVGLPDSDRDRRRLTGVLAGVLQCFQHAEVHGRLHVGAVAADARRFDRGRRRRPASLQRAAPRPVPPT